jgi:DNA polymerase III epsilon subunit-like protein
MSNFKRAPQSPNNFIAFDFETGGVESVKNPVTEIALISITGDKLETISSYQSLIQPYDDTLIYDPRAEKVSGISKEMAEAEGQPIRLVAEQTIAMMEQANTRQEKNAGLRPILIGHNAQFDIAFLTHLMYYGFLGTKTDYQKELERVLHGRRDHYGNFQHTSILGVLARLGFKQKERWITSN